MANDDSFFREVKEDIRNEQFKQAWARYGKYVIAGAAAIIIGVGGWQGYAYYSAKQSAASGDKFMEAIKLSDEGKNDAAIEKLEQLAKSGAGQYPALAKMRIAAERAASGDVKKAIEEYSTIAGDKGYDKMFRDVATLRAGLLMVDSESYDKVLARLQPLAANGEPFRNSAREAIGLAAWKAGQYKDALKWFSEINEDANSPTGSRTRARMMLDLLAGKGITLEKTGTEGKAETQPESKPDSKPETKQDAGDEADKSSKAKPAGEEKPAEEDKAASEEKPASQ